MFSNHVFPAMMRAGLSIDNTRVEDVPGMIRAELDRLSLNDQIDKGSRIAVTAGSRGISQIPVIIKSCLDFLKDLGAHPFIVPAMGSHGGATAKGQLTVLEQLGISESTMGVPVLSSMEVVKIGTTATGDPVYVDRLAWEADGILVVNRVKPHTSMVGEIESGLIKMIGCGLGKEKGCSLHHAVGLEKSLVPNAQKVLATGKIIGGLAVLENSAEEIAYLEALSPANFVEGEKELLAKAKHLTPRLPFEDIDVLIVEEMGKNISGTGMDTKVIGRLMLPHLDDPASPQIKVIVVLDLSSKSEGNAMGIGLADITTQKLFQKIDLTTTYKNVIATGNLNRGKIPLIMSTDREAISTALKVIGGDRVEEVRVVKIRNTLDLKQLYFSEALKEEAYDAPLEMISSCGPMEFDYRGNLL